jgi:peroxiredoxin
MTAREGKTMRAIGFSLVLACLWGFISSPTVFAQSTVPPASQFADLIPQNLLRLVHAPEIHDELKLSTEQVRSLESFFQQSDGIWFRSRILPAEKQRTILAELEAKLQLWLARQLSAAQRQRLEQIEYRSLGVRMLLRPELADRLDLTESQIEQLVELARQTNAATLELQQASLTNKIPEELKAAVAKANQGEQDALQSVVRPEQMQKLRQLLGEPFDTMSLERIYPMAPELIPVEEWINTAPLSLKDLRGKVVVVHFYAFQCHNCHANFDHYNKWQAEFANDDVAIIGIQTPETAREREPSAVRAAAKEKGFEFPVLIDLESDNWKAWSNTMWPTVYVIDKQGYIRYVWQGELNWAGATQDQTIHDLIVKLLREA